MKIDWSNKESVLAEIKKDGFNYQFASAELMADREVLLAAVKNYGWALAHAPSEYQDDKEIVLLAIKNEKTLVEVCSILKYVSRELRHDKEVVDAAIKSHKGAEIYTYPPENEWGDKPYVLRQVREDGHELENASDDLKANLDIISTAIKQNPYAMRHVTSKDATIEIVSKNPKLYNKIHPTLKSDKDVILAAVQSNGLILSDAYYNFTSDKEVVLAAVRQDGLALAFASERLQNDNEVVLAAMQNDIESFEFIGEEIKDMLSKILLEKLEETLK